MIQKPHGNKTTNCFNQLGKKTTNRKNVSYGRLLIDPTDIPS